MKNLNTSKEPLLEAADIISKFDEQLVSANGAKSSQSSHLRQSYRPRPRRPPKLRYNYLLQQLRMHFARSQLSSMACSDPVILLGLSSYYVSVDEAFQRHYYKQQSSDSPSCIKERRINVPNSASSPWICKRLVGTVRRPHLNAKKL